MAPEGMPDSMACVRLLSRSLTRRLPGHLEVGTLHPWGGDRINSILTQLAHSLSINRHDHKRDTGSSAPPGLCRDQHVSKRPAEASGARLPVHVILTTRFSGCVPALTLRPVDHLTEDRWYGYRDTGRRES